MKKLIFVVVGSFGIFIAGDAYAGCRFANKSPVGAYGGYSFYRGLIYQVDKTTGKKLTAYAGVRAQNIGYCALACSSKRNCRAVTWRSGVAKNCLLFSGFDFVTNRPMGLRIYDGGGRARSAIVRTSFRGRLCR